MKLPILFPALLFVLAGSLLAEERPPNIIFMLADDLGYQELGSYGQKYIRTPHIDSLAEEGVKLTQFYTGQAVCAPARCSLLTGKHMGHATIRNNGNPRYRERDDENGIFPAQNPIPDEEVTLAELLKDKGYATAGYGKWGLGYEGSTGDPLKQGFDDFGGFICQIHAHNHYPKFLWKEGKQVVMPGNDRTLHGESYSQDYFIDWSLEFIQENEEQPFFLYLPFAIPHLSIQAPDGSVAEYRDELPEEDYVHKGYLEHPTPRAGYAAMITHMDDGIGEILALLDELGLKENTLVIFTSDNGPTFDRLGGSDSDFFESAGDFKGLKGSLYEGGIRVPLVARWPGEIPAGSVSDHQSAFWDVLPTLCEVAGVESPEDTDGISFLPALKGEEQTEHEYLYWEFPAYGGQQAVRMGDWKGIRQNLMKGPIQTELYNLAEDIGEANDVAAEHPDVLQRIERIMTEARVPSDMFPFPALDEN